MTETTHLDLETLSALLDDDLDAESRAAADRHLAACQPCGARLNAVRALVAEAKALPAAIEPPADVWERVRARLPEPSRAPARSMVMPSWRTSSWFLAAAGLVLVVASSWVTAVVVRRGAGDTGLRAVATSTAPSAGLPAPVARLENDYLRTVRELEETLSLHRARLAPETVVTIEQSLRTIDAALAEARRALAEDPGNQGVLDLFTVTYEQKVDLLRRAAELSSGA